MKSLRVRWPVRELLLATGSLALVLAALEVGTLAGADYRSVFRTPGSFEHGPAVRSDPELRYIMRPHLHEAGSHRGGDIAMAWNLQGPEIVERPFEVRLDRNGFRNAAEPVAPRLAVVGDSFVVGDGVAASELLTARLADRLGVEVVNLGQIGYGPQQELIVLRRFALAYAPRVVLWLVYEGNDLEDHVWFEATRAGWSARDAAERGVWRRSFVRNATLALGRLAARQSEAPQARRRWGTLPDGRRMWFSDRTTDWEDWQLAAFLDLGDVLRMAAGLCAGRAAELVVVFVPAKFRVYGSVCTFPAESECSAWRPNDFPERLGQSVAGIGGAATFVDLTPAFRAHATDDDLLYPPDDAHWSAAGHALAADVLATHPGVVKGALPRG